MFQPTGVVAAISPWNFPLMLESWKIAPALAWGNTVVLKPAEDTPKSATLLARLATEAGLPPGVLNVVHGFGPDSAGSALTAAPRRGPDHLHRRVRHRPGHRAGRGRQPRPRSPSSWAARAPTWSSTTPTSTTPCRWSIKAIFSNAGQVCLAGSRLFVQRGVYDEFVARFVAAAEALRMGDPKDPATELGPLASEEHWKKVTGYLDDVAAGMGRVLTGGPGRRLVRAPDRGRGRAASTPGVVCEEVFGPLVTIHPFDTEEEAVRVANDSPYGLNAMVFTENLSRAHRVSAALKAGHGLGQLLLHPRPAGAVRWCR